VATAPWRQRRGDQDTTGGGLRQLGIRVRRPAAVGCKRGLRVRKDKSCVRSCEPSVL